MSVNLTELPAWAISPLIAQLKQKQKIPSQTTTTLLTEIKPLILLMLSDNTELMDQIILHV